MPVPYRSIDELLAKFDAKRDEIANRLILYKQMKENRDKMLLEAFDYDFTYTDIEELSGISTVTCRNVRKRNGYRRRKLRGRQYTSRTQNEGKI